MDILDKVKLPEETPKWVRYIGVLRIYFLYCLVRNMLGFVGALEIDFIFDFSSLDYYLIFIDLLIIFSLFVGLLSLIYNLRTIPLELRINPKVFSFIIIRWTSILINIIFVVALIIVIGEMILANSFTFIGIKDTLFFISNIAILYTDIYYIRKYRKQKSALQLQGASE